ncbi:MAG: Helicase c2 [Candidatus Gottesmanbacteria bacterium GW2011_GWB1_49_7]|uniref:Helicase c2 n=1 Tax=Candidatus Gottesmanbacteria bacterium GW2011_GWB1_49_7 TaxID=1618448 RepID=A0A0G1W3I5_9BACT|nr:MAG: Helicase c2 [Candidatus Gottesmanbacteria bacterium GW2011_GWB1_49_7]
MASNTSSIALTWTEKLRKVQINGNDVEDRPEQGRYAEAVRTTLENSGHLVIEGGCGTGKSLAYLVPLIEYLHENPFKRVVISTAGRALQQQLINKDIPLAKQIAGEVDVALLQGKANYICPDRCRRALRDPKVSDAARSALSALESGSSMIDDVDLPAGIKSVLGGSTEDCEAKDCKLSKCPYSVAHNKAQEAQVVIVNHHLLALHFHLLHKTCDGDHPVLLLGAIDIIVMDEAHEMPDIARSVMGFSLTSGRFSSLANKYSMLWGQDETSAAIRVAGDSIEVLAKDLFIASREEPRKLVRTPPFDQGQIVSALDDVLIKTENSDSHDSQKLTRRATALKNDFLQVATLARPTEFVYWPDKTGKNSHGFECRRLHPGTVLRNFLQPLTVIATSATMDVGDDFAFIKHELGLPDAASEKIGSPFDFKTNARWMTPPDMKVQDPNHPDFPWQACQAIESAVRASNGRALILCTSYRLMEVYENKLKTIPGIHLLVQRSAPLPELVREFKTTPNAVLLGVSSLWTGVDIPGDALSLLVIDKIPFPQIKEPVIEALSEIRGRDAWSKVQVPRAWMKARQGVGRLIRGKTDRGVILWLDPRVVIKSYGRDLRETMPYMPRLTTYNELAEFLRA